MFSLNIIIRKYSIFFHIFVNNTALSHNTSLSHYSSLSSMISHLSYPSSYHSMISSYSYQCLYLSWNLPINGHIFYLLAMCLLLIFCLMFFVFEFCKRDCLSFPIINFLDVLLSAVIDICSNYYFVFAFISIFSILVKSCAI